MNRYEVTIEEEATGKRFNIEVNAQTPLAAQFDALSKFPGPKKFIVMREIPRQAYQPRSTQVVKQPYPHDMEPKKDTNPAAWRRARMNDESGS